MNANSGNFQHIAYAFKTDVGKKRKNNEDALGAFPEGGVFCVADGMGGGDDGEIASAAVVKAVDDAARRCATGAGHAAKDVAAAVEKGLSEASSWIWKRASNKKISVCGSTFVGVVFDSVSPSRAMALHAGDSRVYLIRGKSVKQVTRDHSASEMMGEKDENKVNPLFRSMIVNAVGIHRSVECERTPFKVAEGDRVLICSDGLYRMVADRQMGEILSANPDVEKAVDALVAAALAGGGVDNVSVVLCELGKLPRPLAADPVPDSAGTASSATSVTGEDGEAAPTDGDATRETMIPAFEGVVEGAVFGEPSDAAVATKKAEAQTRRRLTALVAVAVSVGMLAVAAVVFLMGRAPTAAVVPEAPAVAPTRPVTTNRVVRPCPPVVKTNRTDVVTNAPIVVVPAPKPSVPAVTLPVAEEARVAKVELREPVASPATNRPCAKSEPQPFATIVAACDARTVADFAETMTKLNASADSLREFDEQMRRFRESAAGCARMRSEKYVHNVVIDLKYLMTSAEAAKERLAGEVADERIRRFLDDWALVVAGSEKDVQVQEASARLILGAQKLKAK